MASLASAGPRMMPKALAATTHQTRGMALTAATGPGGRSSVSGIQATVFGATGFLGRYVVNKLGRMGSQVVVPYRGDEHDTRHLKVMGDYGQIVMVPWHMREADSIANVVKHSNVVINVCGQHCPSLNFTVDQANNEGTRAIAEAAKAAGVERFIHVSSLNASADSKSAFARSKAAGEAAVREIYPDATVLQPGSMFGQEDRFLARIAGQAKAMAVFPFADGAGAKRSPVDVMDVAEAIAVCVRDASTSGNTYQLSGPGEYTLEEVYNMIFASIGSRPLTLWAPHQIMAIAGRVAQILPSAPLTQDEVMLMTEDEVVSDGAKTAADLGIATTPLEEKIGKILLRFKPAEISAKDAGIIL